MWTVHQVAKRAGLPARTVRYYDRIGLVAASGRTEAGYRVYDAEGEGRLRFVRQARALGLSLDEVRELMAAAEAGCCDGVLPELDRVLTGKIGELDQRIAEMREFRDRLVAFRAGSGSACGCSGHGAFCACLEAAPQLVDLERGGTRWLASVDAVVPAAHRSRRSSAIRTSSDGSSRSSEKRSSGS